MGKIAIIPKPSPQDTGSAAHPTDASMPLLYMADYSVIGLVVGDCARAIEVLRANAVSVSAGPSGSVVHFPDGRALGEILKLLRGHAIDCGISDIVNQVYQG